MLFGYARVSGADQNPAHQVDALTRAGINADNIHTDHASGAKASRPQLDAVLTRLRSGDTLVVTRLDQISRAHSLFPASSKLLLIRLAARWDRFG